jgi:hypothetical protein
MPYGLSSRSTFHEADEFTVRACCSGTFNAYTREADPARLATAAVTRLKATQGEQGCPNHPGAVRGKIPKPEEKSESD